MNKPDRKYLIETSSNDRRSAGEIRQALARIGVWVDPSYETRVGLGESGTLILRGKASDDAAEQLRQEGFQIFPDVEVSAFGPMGPTF
jgi:hypothetical protein